jgi:hypothetical protein
LPGTNILLRWWWMAVVMARKKHFAQSGSRATKGKVANAIRRDEIVEAVVDNTKPWRNHESRDTVTAAVNQALLRRSFLIQDQLGNMPKSSTKRSAKSRRW